MKIYKKIVPSGVRKFIVMDDETYVPQDPTQVPGSEFYCKKPSSNSPDSVLFEAKTKFFKKFLLWQAIDMEGNVSEPFITKGTINGKIYLE